MLMIVHRVRAVISPILASAFALGLLLAPAGVTEVRVADHAAAAEQREADGQDHHHHGTDDLEPSRSADRHGAHECGVCLCFATPSGCSVAALSVVATVAAPMSPERTVSLRPAAHLPPAYPSSDIFHPPRL